MEEKFVNNKLTLSVIINISVNKKSLLRSQEFENNMKCVSELGMFSDIAIVCDGEKFPCHGNVLATRSSIFKAMFTWEIAKKDMKEVEIEDSTKEAMEAWINHIYTGEMSNMPAMFLSFIATI